MSKDERKQSLQELIKGLELAEYRMLREKAIRNQTVIQGDEQNGWREVSARELFVKLYNQPVATY